ncbi:uncharacterized protein LOC133180503 [Saccostrea echinata]|uniref:uncharacterized protein LOC133180503 n=1 Tax=Saccostrea echinata TaxID=191078 RepID=UPI002A833689|nr:uncharacterized protein LOC133180503 [Saccostrea echinata]
MGILTVACVLLMQTITIDCVTKEMMRPFGTVKIQPLYFSNLPDEVKRVATTRCVFFGPHDLTASFSGIDGTFTKVSEFDKDTSEYKAVFQSSMDIKSFGKLTVQSASTSETLSVDFDLPQSSNSTQIKFPFKSCKFEVQRYSDGQTTNYSATAKECGKLASNEMYLYFPVKLSEWNSAKYVDASSVFYHSPETTANTAIKTSKLAQDDIDITSLDFSIMNFYGTNSPLSHYLIWSFQLI